VRLRTPDTRWVRRLALRLGEDGRVISPPELAGQVRRDAAEALAGYAEPPHGPDTGPAITPKAAGLSDSGT